MLRNKHRTGISNRNLQCEAHRGFTTGLPPLLVKEWEDLCVAWESAAFPKSKSPAVNPYEVPELCT
jgi:hypothetical protein